jgi:hypothetical protein
VGPLLEVLAEPFIVPAMDGSGALEVGNVGGAMESRLDLLPAVDGLGVLGGEVDWEVLPDEPVELSCFVGDLLGDCPYQLRYP